MADSMVDRLSAKWLEEQGEDIEPTYDRNRTDSRLAVLWFIEAIADEAPSGEDVDWLRRRVSDA